MIQVRTIDDARRALMELNQGFGALARWRNVPANWFAVTAPGQISCTSTRLSWPVGLPISWIQPGGNRSYGLIRGVSDGVVSIAGPPMSTDADLQGLWIGRPEMVAQLDWFIPGSVGAAAGDQMALLGRKPVWSGPLAYIVDFSMGLGTDAVTANPFFNVVAWRDGVWRSVSTANGNAGIQASQIATVHNPIGSIQSAYYQIGYAQRLSAWCSTPGVGTEAQNLSVAVSIVME